MRTTQRIIVIITLTGAFTQPAAAVTQCLVPDYVEFTADDASANAFFGDDIDIDGELAIIGAPLDGNSGTGSGAAYIFQNSGFQWQQLTKLTPTDPTICRRFGDSVAIDGDTAVVAARLVIPSAFYRSAIYVFRNIDGVWQQIALLSNSLGSGDDVNDFNVDIQGDVVVAGAPRSTNKGAVYVFREINGIWLSTAIPSPEPEDGFIQFGASVVLADDDLIVGAPYALNSYGERTGAVYMFRESLGNWTQYRKLIADDAPENTRLGVCLAWKNDTLVVGATLTTTEYDNQGAAYVFHRSGSQWLQTARLTPPEDLFATGFGGSAAISGDTIAVGAKRLAGTITGAIITYQDRNGWEFAGSLTPLEMLNARRFGYSVALDGDSLLGGATNGSVDVYASGLVYAFDLAAYAQDCNGNGIADICDLQTISTDCNGNGVPDECDIARQFSADCNGDGQPDECDFVEIDALARFTSTDGAVGQRFGWSADLDGDTAVIGAVNDSAFGYRSGAAYIFRNSGDGWQELARLVASDADENDQFGVSVSTSGGTAVIGAYGEGGDYSGAAYVFEETENGWQQIAKLTPSDPAPSKSFGYRVAIEGDTILVTASGDSEIAPYSGAVYVFRKTGGTWQETQKLKANDASNHQSLGRGIALDGDTFVAGTPRPNPTTGDMDQAAYVFREIDGAWQQVAKLTDGDDTVQSGFGNAVDIHGDTIIVSASRNNPDDPTDQAAAYVFREIDGEWHQIAMLANNTTPEDGSYGRAVAINGDTALIGLTNETVTTPGAINRPVFVYRELNGTWRRIARLTRSDDSLADHFGGSIAMEGDFALVGAAWSPEVTPVGAAYTFDLSVFALAGDLNNDRSIDLDDVAILVNVLLDADSNPMHVARADLNCSGEADGRDLQAFLAQLIAP
ncbi:MAG: hypothetical protein H6818_17570 [Phycisphaerales bacterium]|nr:hypothetical protein [Phycisphaerales bacterium]